MSQEKEAETASSVPADDATAGGGGPLEGGWVLGFGALVPGFRASRGMIEGFRVPGHRVEGLIVSLMHNRNGPST